MKIIWYELEKYVLKCPHRFNLSLLCALSTFLPLPPPCPAPVGEGRIPAGWGLSPGRTGALSPEGRGHRLTDSLATSDQAGSKGEGGRERVIGHNDSGEDVHSGWNSLRWSFVLAWGQAVRRWLDTGQWVYTQMWLCRRPEVAPRPHLIWYDSVYFTLDRVYFEHK